MLYAIVGSDAVDSLPARKLARPAHVERLRALQAQGRLVLAGPFPAIDAADISGGVTGSLIVAAFDSLADAQAWANAEPYLAAGVYVDVSVRPFIQAFPE